MRFVKLSTLMISGLLFGCAPSIELAEEPVCRLELGVSGAPLPAFISLYESDGRHLTCPATWSSDGLTIVAFVDEVAGSSCGSWVPPGITVNSERVISVQEAGEAFQSCSSVASTWQDGATEDFDFAVVDALDPFEGSMAGPQRDAYLTEVRQLADAFNVALSTSGLDIQKYGYANGIFCFSATSDREWLDIFRTLGVNLRPSARISYDDVDRLCSGSGQSGGISSRSG